MSLIWALLLSSVIVFCVNADLSIQVVEPMGKNYIVPLSLTASKTRNITLVGGLSYRLGCQSNVGFGSQSFAWTNAGVTVSSDSSSAVYQAYDSELTTWNLVLTPFSLAATGTYSCTDISSSAAITIGQGNPVAVASDLLVVKRIGDITGVSLQCFTSGIPAPAYLLWSSPNQMVVNSTTTNSPFSVSGAGTSLSSSMAGLYSCTAVTSAGSATGETIVEVITPPQLYKTFSAGPVAYENGNLTLTCVASQGSPLTFTWTFGGSTLSNGGRVSIVGLNSSASQLTVVQLTYSDAGTYQCIVAALRLALSDSFSLPVVVQYAPILNPVFSYNVTGIENSSAILALTAMSVPSMLGVVWTKDGNVLASNVSKYSTSFFNSSSGPLSNISLTILGLKVTDGGYYLCTVTNSFKATSVRFNVVVMTAPVLVPSPSGSQVLGIMGYSLVITVQLLGANPPVSVGSITWQAGGSPLSPGGRVALTYSSTSVTLNISALSSGDDGTNYTLMVSHPTGTRNHSFQLLIKAPPLPPTNLIVSFVSGCAFTLGWSPPAVNSSSIPAQQVVLQIRTNGSGQWADIGPPVPAESTSVVLDQPYVGGAGVVSGQMYEFRGVSLYQSIRGPVSAQSALVMANPGGTHPVIGMVTANPASSSQSVTLRWTVVTHSCYVISRYNLTCGPASAVVVNPLATSGEVVGLSPDAQYNCTVAVVYSDPVGVYSSSLTNWTFTYPAIPMNTIAMLPLATQVMETSFKVSISPPSGFVSSRCWIVVLLGSAPVGSPDLLYPAGYTFGVYQAPPSSKARDSLSPYITAEIPLSGQETMEFTVGDNSANGGYLNGPLSMGAKYSIFVRYFATSSFTQRQYSVFVSTDFLVVQLPSTPATLAPGGAVTPANTSIITGAVAGGVVLVILVCVLIFVGCGVIWYRRRALLKEDEQVDASFVPQSTGTFSYTKADNDSTMSPPPSLYNTLPPQSSRPIPVAHKDKERELEKELLSDNIPDGPLPPTFSPPPTYRNLMEAEQLSPSNMKTSEPVPASHFDQYVARRDEKKGLLFEKEFKSIQENSPRYSATASDDPLNAEKNRYSNIVAFDHTRVKLTPLVGVAQSDYINANFIKGYPRSTNYIAAQGPLDQTVNDFWRMIWEHNVPTIVMLTNIMEDGKAKCSQYWPIGSSAQEYGGLMVKVEQTIILPDHTIRSLTVTSASGEPRTVLHFHYTNWHDYGTPTHLAPLINFVRVVNQSHVEHSPLLVHCSAGVGRTGTVIAIDYCMKQIHEEGEVDVKGVVSLLRGQRNFMVQTEQQFMCIHYVLLEAILCGDTSYVISDFSAEYPHLQLKNVATGVSLVEEEFKKLTSIKTMISKSSFISKVKAAADQEYPAYFVKSYLNTQQFIVADGPSVDTIEHFWQMLADNGYSNIVTLTPTDVGVDPYWPPCNQKMSFSNISVEVLEELSEHMYNVRKIMLTSRTGSTHHIMQYEFIGWTADKMPDMAGFVRFVYDVARRIDEGCYTNNSILVHDTTSVGPSGIFCALWHCIERLRLEKVVDVFQAVQKLQLQKPGMVETVKQYAFIYDCVHEFINLTITTTTTNTTAV